MKGLRLLKTAKYSLVIVLLTFCNLFAQSYKIVETGQVTFYDNSKEINQPNKGDVFYGQDAQYESLKRSYKDNNDGTISDLNTGLMWQKGLFAEKYTYAQSVIYADTCTLAGYTDWRLPTIKEIYSLMLFSGRTGMSESNSIPYIDTDYFDFRFGGESVTDPNERFIDAQYVTSTIYKGTTMNGNETMFGLNLVDGRIKGYPTFKNFEIKLVRGSETYGINDFVDNNDGTISDKATGLMWEKSGDNGGMNWEAALAFAESKNAENYLGYNNWRLPNAKELHSILDYERSPSFTNSAAISSVFDIATITNEKGETDYPFYWTSTTHYDGPSPQKAVYVCFGEALGYMFNSWVDVHGAGAQRSDPKAGDPNDYPTGFGPQGDAIRINNYVRLVRSDENSTPNTGQTEGGHTLFAPLGNKTTYLIDEKGDVTKTWQSDNAPGLSAYLIKGKSLLRTGSVGRNGNSRFGTTGGSGGKVEKYDWDGNKTWEFEYNSDTYLLHHDIEYLSNGNILMIAWEYKNKDEVIAAGRDISLLSDNELWPDKIIEVKPDGISGGTIVWEWRVWDHLIQDYDATKSNYGNISEHPEKVNLNFVLNTAADWNHINGIDYNEEFDQILLTVRNFSEIWIIDHNTTTSEAAGNKGDLLYRWGNPQTYGMGSSSDQKLFVPHNAYWINKDYPGGGDILVFNNGDGRSDGNYSSVDQITTTIDQNGNYTLQSNSAFGPTDLTWRYKGNPTSSFYANHISGAQRLKGGNTLICLGTSGKFLEVTSDGNTVWEYTNPYTFTNPQNVTQNSVFRAERYNLEDLEVDVTDITEQNEIPTEYSLEQNYPNPFNPTTNISFSLPTNGNVRLSIYNSLGQLVTNLVSQTLSSGKHSFNWNASDLSSGIYVTILIVDGKLKDSKKMVLMK